MTRYKSKRSRRRGGKARGKTWCWLGIGALGLGVAAALWLRRRPDCSGPLAPRASTSRQGTWDEDHEPPDSNADPAPQLAGDLAPFWLPGPAGRLRVVDLKPAAARQPLTVLFIHGLGGRLEHWSPQLAERVEGVRRVALDLPGHGASDPLPPDFTTEGYSPPALAQAVAAVVDALGLHRVVLVAHSWGAAVATAYAGAQPERVAGLLLVDPNGDSTRLPAAERAAFLAAIQADPAGELRAYFQQILVGAQPGVADAVLASLAAVSAEVLSACVAGHLVYSPLPDLERFSGPCQLVLSDLNDLPYSLHRLLPTLPAHPLRNTSHWLMLDQPIPFARLLEDFLNRVIDHSKARPGPGDST